MTEKILYTIGLSSVTLSEVIQLYKEKLQGAIALLYSPQSCYFAKFEQSGKLMIPNSENPHQEIQLELDYQKNCIFEARIFNEDSELRWLNDYDGIGKAVLIAESQPFNNSESEQEFKSSLKDKDSYSKNRNFIDTIPQQYLIWGEKIHDHSLENWLTVSTARIGKLNIPLNKDLEEKQRIYLKTVEYLAEVDDFGNVSVIEERLIKLEVN